MPFKVHDKCPVLGAAVSTALFCVAIRRRANGHTSQSGNRLVGQQVRGRQLARFRYISTAFREGYAAANQLRERSGYRLHGREPGPHEIMANRIGFADWARAHSGGTEGVNLRTAPQGPPRSMRLGRRRVSSKFASGLETSRNPQGNRRSVAGIFMTWWATAKNRLRLTGVLRVHVWGVGKQSERILR